MIKKKEKFANVFEASSLFGKENKELESKIVEQVEPLNLPPIPEVPENLPPIESSEDLLEQFKRCEQLHQNLEAQVAEFCQKYNISLVEFRRKLEDPTQFSSAEWKKIRGQVNQVKEQIAKLVPERELQAEEDEQETHMKKKSSMLSKRRWLSMH